MNIENNLKDNDANLVVSLTCHIDWRLPPKDTEEKMYRETCDRALAKIAYELQESVGHTFLAVIRLKKE